MRMIIISCHYNYSFLQDIQCSRPAVHMCSLEGVFSQGTRGPVEGALISDMITNCASQSGPGLALHSRGWAFPCDFPVIDKNLRSLPKLVLSEKGFNEDDGHCLVRSWCSGVSQEQGRVQVSHRGTGGVLQCFCAFGPGWQQLRNEEEKESHLSDS